MVILKSLFPLNGKDRDLSRMQNLQNNRLLEKFTCDIYIRRIFNNIDN
jgi:hypothetical protein